MNSEGISSIAVVDNHFNVVGNISTTDVKVMQLISQADPQLAKRKV
jgi:CBS domain-containing protein